MGTATRDHGATPSEMVRAKTFLLMAILTLVSTITGRRKEQVCTLGAQVAIPIVEPLSKGRSAVTAFGKSQTLMMPILTKVSMRMI